jgi:phosphopantothenoylcysteine decarboxylase/phosphopantothenate--cysteine ligase
MHPSESIYCTKSEKLKGKRIAVAVTGSIAAIETVKLVRELIRHGAEVHPIMSPESQKIIHSTSLEFASGKEPILEIGGDVAYIGLMEGEKRANLLLIAPCTSNTLSKIACGMSDTIVTLFATQAMGLNIPMIIVPSMHLPMYKNPIIANHMKDLKKLGVEFVEPKVEESAAKLPEIDDVVARVFKKIGKDAGTLKKNKVIVIGGATREPIDDVRFVTAHSTGATAVELAISAYERGADVELWMGGCETSIPNYIAARRFGTTNELASLVKDMKCDYCFVPAAISDFTPQKKKGKIPSTKKEMDVTFKATPKVIDSIRKNSDCFLVGFKAEHGISRDELVTRALKRLKSTKLDMIVANDLTDVGKDESEIVIIDKKGKCTEARGSRKDIAESIWKAVVDGTR